MRISSILYFIVGFLVLIGLFFLFRGQVKTDTSGVTSQTPTPPSESQQTLEISMTTDKFEPSTVVIKKGTKVIFVNADEKPRWPASDLHPTHGIYPEFDPKVPIDPKGNWNFVFDKVGTWKYHDHLLSYIRGQIKVVEEGDSLEVPNPGHFRVNIENKKITGENKFTVVQGETVTFEITSDESEEFHIHGIDKFVDLTPGSLVTLEFTAEVSGRFPIELEKSKTEIATLEVQPKSLGQ